MSSEDDDGVPPISSGPGAGAPTRRGRARQDVGGRAHGIGADGHSANVAAPMCMAVVMDDGSCRWRTEFMEDRRGCRCILDERRRAAGLTDARTAEQMSAPTRGAGKVTVLGVAVFLTFAFLGDRQQEGAPWLDDDCMEVLRVIGRLADHAAGARRRTRARSASLVLFPVLAAARFTEPILLDGVPSTGARARLHADIMLRLSGVDTRLIIGQVVAQPAALRAGETVSVAEFVRLCVQSFGFKQSLRAPIVTNMWSVIAEPLLRGRWPCDFAPLSLRTPAALAHRLIDSQPPRHLIVSHLASVAAEGARDEDDAGADPRELEIPRCTRRFGRQDLEEVAAHGAMQYDCTHMIRALKATAKCRSLAELRGNAIAAVAFALPQMVPTLREEMNNGDLMVPSRWSLARGRVHLDIAAMLLARRSHRAPHTSVTRYLVYDASPKNGLEVFAVKEKCSIDGDLTRAKWRHMPLSTLGSGHAGALDKVACIMHAIFLVAGPRIVDMRRWAHQVRWGLSDCGAEMLAVDAPDLLDEFMQHRFGDEELTIGDMSGRGFLFPLAMRGPGWNHLVDLIVKEVCLKYVEWFPEWLRKARVMCNFLRVRNYRERLIATGKARGVDAAELKALQCFSASFAKWRWGTLRIVCKALETVRQGVRLTWPHTAFRFKDASLTAAVNEVVGNEPFWARSSALCEWAGDMEHLRTWATGCPCHEDECKEAARKHTVYQCPNNRKGCRAPQVSAKLDQTWHDWEQKSLEALRKEWPVAGLAISMSNAYRQSAAEGRLRFGWARELPWLIWDCRERAGAQRVRAVFQALPDETVRAVSV